MQLSYFFPPNALPYLIQFTNLEVIYNSYISHLSKSLANNYYYIDTFLLSNR